MDFLKAISIFCFSVHVLKVQIIRSSGAWGTLLIRAEASGSVKALEKICQDLFYSEFIMADVGDDLDTNRTELNMFILDILSF